MKPINEGGPVVAVMQPYFYPYAGYYRLLAAADVFVVLDDVQFPRRGRVHRCETPRAHGSTEWLTLPLARQPRSVKIADLAFHDQARPMLDQRLRRLPGGGRGSKGLALAVTEHLYSPLTTPREFLERGLELVADGLGFGARRVRASSLDVDHDLRGQAYIIALAQAAGAGVYVNAPGGRHLYDPASFEAAGLKLRFLPNYSGRYRFMVPALMSEDPQALRDDILATTRLVV